MAHRLETCRHVAALRCYVVWTAFGNQMATAVKNRWVLLDEEGEPVRYFDYEAEGTVKVVEPKWKVDWNNYEECLF